MSFVKRCASRGRGIDLLQGFERLAVSVTANVDEDYFFLLSGITEYFLAPWLPSNGGMSLGEEEGAGVLTLAEVVVL